MRHGLYLLPAVLSIALCAPAYADQKPLNWTLCPALKPLPGLENIPVAPKPSAQEAHIPQPTTIEGDKLSGTNTTPLYQGNVSLTRGDQYLGADRLYMDTKTGNYVAEGHVRYQNPAFQVVAQRAEGNQDTDTHKVSDIQYQLTALRGNGTAQSVDIQGQVAHLHYSTYSTCDPSDQVWKVRAPEIDVDDAEGFGIAHKAVIVVDQHRVMYVPWLKFPTDDRRLSGLLYPSLRFTSRFGLDYTQPIYWNIAPNYDATFFPRLMSKRGIMLDSQWRYLFTQGRGTLYLAFLPHDRVRNKDRGRFQYAGFQNLNAHWQARANLNYVSDTHYMEDFSQRMQGIPTASTLQSTIGAYYTGQTVNASVSVDHWQLTDYTLDQTALPYDRLPRLLFDWDRPILPWLEAGMHTEAVHFIHTDSYGIIDTPTRIIHTGEINKKYYYGNRLDIKPFISFPVSGASWFITPTFAWRYTAYQIPQGAANALSSSDKTPHRSLPIISTNAGLYFDRETAFNGNDYIQTLEPQLYYLYVPYRNQNALPVFDTRAFTFSWGQLFRDTRYTGADRQNDANQISLAMTSRWLRQEDGRETLTLRAGQIFYLQNSRVNLDPTNEDEIEHGKSAWVADLDYYINDRWSVGGTYQWNPNFRRKELASFRARYLMNNDGVINLAYRYRRNASNGIDQLQQMDFSFLYPINANWSLVGRYYYSLLDKKPLEKLAGVQWDSCCIAFRIYGRQAVRSRQGDMGNSIQFEFLFKGFGSLGQNTDRTLRRAILGYDRDDLYLVPPDNQIQTNSDDYNSNSIP